MYFMNILQFLLLVVAFSNQKCVSGWNDSNDDSDSYKISKWLKKQFPKKQHKYFSSEEILNDQRNQDRIIADEFQNKETNELKLENGIIRINECDLEKHSQILEEWRKSYNDAQITEYNQNKKNVEAEENDAKNHEISTNNEEFQFSTYTNPILYDTNSSISNTKKVDSVLFPMMKKLNHPKNHIGIDSNTENKIVEIGTIIIKKLQKILDMKPMEVDELIYPLLKYEEIVENMNKETGGKTLFKIRDKLVDVVNSIKNTITKYLEKFLKKDKLLDYSFVKKLHEAIEGVKELMKPIEFEKNKLEEMEKVENRGILKENLETENIFSDIRYTLQQLKEMILVMDEVSNKEVMQEKEEEVQNRELDKDYTSLLQTYDKIHVSIFSWIYLILKNLTLILCKIVGVACSVD